MRCDLYPQQYDSNQYICHLDASKHELNTRIQDYITEIRRTTRQHDAAEDYERELMRSIISEWNEMKSLRIVQGFSNTTIKLTVKRQEVGSRTGFTNKSNCVNINCI